ncbi:alpha/beta hydrolase [Winogradskya consettensis]|uniref:Alpha/beta hydrolase n=1 Tax=Winogradskya consettensis TaxID=113560 RepID=A0A919T312_9ACTN|nr:alpha/beta hydrolase [Actinoplanes consettensis]GIM82460.1 alpha/beta hydrolase [Actinoplanes consettensis]
MIYLTATPAGASVAVLDLGASDPVRVYVGGLGSSTGVGFGQVTGHPLLGGTGRHILIDLIGSGWSDHDDTFGHTIDEHAGTVIAVLDGLGLTDVTLVGHSLGGSVVISAAAQRPDLVSTLVVAEPNLDPGIGSFSAEVAAFDEDTFAATEHERMIAELRTASDTDSIQFSRTLPRWSARGLHRTSVSLIADRPETFREQFYAFPGPRIYISGELSAEDLDPLRGAGVDVRVVPASGHALMLDNLDGFAAAIASAHVPGDDAGTIH